MLEEAGSIQNLQLLHSFFSPKAPKPLPKIPPRSANISLPLGHPQTFSLHRSVLCDEFLEVDSEPLWALGAVRAATRAQCGRLGLVDLAEIQEPLRLGRDFPRAKFSVFLKSRLGGSPGSPSHHMFLKYLTTG